MNTNEYQLKWKVHVAEWLIEYIESEGIFQEKLLLNFSRSCLGQAPTYTTHGKWLPQGFKISHPINRIRDDKKKSFSHNLRPWEQIECHPGQKIAGMTFLTFNTAPILNTLIQRYFYPSEDLNAICFDRGILIVVRV